LTEPVATLVDIGDTELYVKRRGSGYPIIVLHGGPGGDHVQFEGYLDPLSSDFALHLVDQRSQGRSSATPPETWTARQMAADVVSLARRLGLHEYAVLGHSFGGIVALEHAVRWPGAARQTIVSHAVPSLRWYRIGEELAKLEPESVRRQIAEGWNELEHAVSDDEVSAAFAKQTPFHFADTTDPRADESSARLAALGATWSGEVNRQMQSTGYGGFDVEGELARITQPVLVLTGRWERTCPHEAAEFMAARIPSADLVIFEHSAHVSYIEENDAYLRTVASWLETGSVDVG